MSFSIRLSVIKLSEIAGTVGATCQTVRTWRERFAKNQLGGLNHKPIEMATTGLKRS
jgi:hypothetical protein